MRDWGDFRKLYEKPSPAFERLPYQARCMAADIIRRCDRLGRVVPGAELNDDLVGDLAFHVRAHSDEHEFIRLCVGVLLDDRYFIFDDGYLTIRNFVDAQRTASAERMALKRARDAAAAMDYPDGSSADFDSTPGLDPPRDARDGSDTGDASDGSDVTCAPLACARSGLVSSGLVSDSQDQLGTGNKPGSTRARVARVGSDHVPVAMPESWEPSAAQTAALAEKYSVTTRRILAEVAEFRWYWSEGKGRGKRSTLRGWAQTFGNRIEILAKKGSLFIQRPDDVPEVKPDDAEARRRRAADVEARARAARDAKARQTGTGGRQ